MVYLFEFVVGGFLFGAEGHGRGGMVIVNPCQTAFIAHFAAAYKLIGHRLTLVVAS